MAPAGDRDMKLFQPILSALALATALLLPAHAPATAQPAAAQQRFPTAAQIAQTLQGRLPMDLGNNIRAVAIAAEGQILVWTLDVPATLIAGHSAREVTDAIMAGFCRGPGAQMFDHGVALRVDTSSDGAPPARGMVVTRCPSALAQ